MAFEIAINELGFGNDKAAYVMLPTNRNVVIDAMDREKIFGKELIRISMCDDVPELEDHGFSEEPTLDELNFLAKRIDEISANRTRLAAYRALLNKPFNTIREAINRTYNLKNVHVFPCKNEYAYGEMVLKNELFEDLNNLPDEIYDLLDPSRVGRAMMKRENGEFIDVYYVPVDTYEPVLVYDEELPEHMDDWIFKLEIAGVPEEAEDSGRMKTETLTLPADEEHMQDIAEALGERHINECVSMKFESMIPHINNDTWSMEEIYLLNDIAREYAEMSREDAAKFKAVLCKEQPNSLNGVRNILNSLDQYEVDISIYSFTEFGSKYLEKMLPPDFDKSLLKNACSASFGHKILCENDCALTEYGVISGYGVRLFSLIEAPQQEQENNFKMGGIL